VRYTTFLLDLVAATIYGQAQPVMTSVSMVTAPFCAKALPSRLTPVVIVIDVSARMLPLN
jgi:hypothetical protein